MSQFSSSLLLRRALIADAAASGATGLLLLAGPGLLDRLLGLPTAFLRGAGLLLVPYVVFVAWVGMRARIARGPVWAAIVAHAAWAMASIGWLPGTNRIWHGLRYRSGTLGSAAWRCAIRRPQSGG